MIIKGLRYCFYMMTMRLKGIKYNRLKKSMGTNCSEQYMKKLLKDWVLFTKEITEMNIETIGSENIPNEPCVFIANHQSILDIPTIFISNNKDIKFIGKKELLKTPFIGYWFKKGIAIPIDRENPREAIKSINESIESIKNGYSIAIFPEGTRSKTSEVLDFKKGSFRIAVKSKAPIVPVSIIGTERTFKNKLKITPSKVKIIYDRPIYTDNLSKEELKNIHNITRDIIIKNKEKHLN